MVKLTFGEYIWETYSEAERRVSALAAGLRDILGPCTADKSDSGGCPTPLVIFSETRSEWLYAAEASWRLNRPIATLYATLGDDAVVHGLEQTEVSFDCTFYVSTQISFDGIAKESSLCWCVSSVRFPCQAHSGGTGYSTCKNIPEKRHDKPLTKPAYPPNADLCEHICIRR